MAGIGFGVCTNVKEDCFAFLKGKCRALSNGDFKGRECPFYKSKEEVDTSYLGELGEEENDGV